MQIGAATRVWGGNVMGTQGQSPLQPAQRQHSCLRTRTRRARTDRPASRPRQRGVRADAWPSAVPERARCVASPALEGGEGSPLHPTQHAVHLLTCGRACPCDRPDG
eukprot:908365-Prymnesium_polylepis.1